MMYIITDTITGPIFTLFFNELPWLIVRVLLAVFFLRFNAVQKLKQKYLSTEQVSKSI